MFSFSFAVGGAVAVLIMTTGKTEAVAVGVAGEVVSIKITAVGRTGRAAFFVEDGAFFAMLSERRD